MTELRDAVLSDLKRLNELENECFSNPWSENEVLYSILNDREKFTVSVTDGIVSGFIIYSFIVDEGEIMDICVSETFRRNHIGSLLMESLLSDAERNNITSVFLEVRESNTAARKLYEKYGFEQYNLRKNYYTNPNENAVLMKKALGSLSQD